MHSPEYVEAIIQNGPESFAAEIAPSRE